MRDRSHLDGSELATPIVDIDDIRNGVLLRADLHASLGKGEDRFLKGMIISQFFWDALETQPFRPRTLD